MSGTAQEAMTRNKFPKLPFGRYWKQAAWLLPPKIVNHGGFRCSPTSKSFFVPT